METPEQHVESPETLVLFLTIRLTISICWPLLMPGHGPRLARCVQSMNGRPVNSESSSETYLNSAYVADLPVTRTAQGEKHELTAQDFLFHWTSTSDYDSVIRPAGEDRLRLQHRFHSVQDVLL
jgi:hypothetical protein